jgi:5-methyltetrahydrofolate--homocysteine methyltransferase
LTNNGYEVHNLGTKVAISEMVSKAEEVGADVIGMSGLLVKSTLIMRDNLLELNERGLDRYPVILGGAALTRTYVERDLRSQYKGRLFYGKDAFEGLRTMDKLMEFSRNDEDDPAFGRALGGRPGVPPRRQPRTDAGEPGERPPRAPSVEADNAVPVPPFLGSRVERGIPLNEIAKYINETSLFRNQWGYRPLKGETDAQFKARIRAVLRQQLELARQSDVLRPAVAYGYFPANSDGDDLVIWEDEQRSSEVTRFNFPRQDESPWLCISDFFKPVSSGELDYATFHVVTMGPAASEQTAKLFAEDRYTDYLHLHGLSVEMTEALAEYWHRRIREEWGFAGEDGPNLHGLFRQQYRSLLVGVPGMPRPRGQRPLCLACRRRADRRGVLGGNLLAVPSRADNRRHHLPPPTGEVLHCPPDSRDCYPGVVTGSALWRSLKPWVDQPRPSGLITRDSYPARPSNHLGAAAPMANAAVA